MPSSFRNFGSLIFFAAGLSLTARAADLNSPLTWKDALALAQKNNPEFESARLQTEASQARFKNSYNGVLPSVDLTHSYSESNNTTSTSDRWGAQASASWDLFNRSKFSSISLAEAAYVKSQASLKLVSSDVRLKLSRAFSGLLYSQFATKVNATILGIRSTNTKMVSLRYESGRESKGNRLRSEAELLQAQMDVTQAQRDLKSGQQTLRQQLGDANFQTITATGTLTAVIPAEPDFEKLVDANPVTAQKMADVAAARASVSQAKSSLWPNLTARYTQSLSGHDEFPTRPGWSAGGVLSLPVFGSGPTSTFYSIRESLDARAAAEADLKAARLQVRSDLESAWSDLQSSVDQLKVQEAFLIAARQRNKEADVRYSSGLIAYEDWERIVTERINFEKSMIQAQRNAAVADAVWRQAQGFGLEDDL